MVWKINFMVKGKKKEEAARGEAASFLLLCC
jgi:hypothetical protein